MNKKKKLSNVKNLRCVPLRKYGVTYKQLKQLYDDGLIGLDDVLFDEIVIERAIDFYVKYKDDSDLLKKDQPDVYKEFEKFVEKLNKDQFSKKGVYLPPGSISLDAYDWFVKWCLKLRRNGYESR